MTKMILLVLLSASSFACVAEPVRIVAFGGSNTFGPRLPRSEAYPAQLEALLRAKGFDVQVSNEGTNGQTTAEELGRLNGAVPEGTRIVIFQPDGNDRQVGGIDTAANIHEIVRRLVSRKIYVLFSSVPPTWKYVQEFNVSTIGEINRLAPGHLQYDGQHLTKEGYGIVAQQMLPRISEFLETIRQERVPGTLNIPPKP